MKSSGKDGHLSIINGYQNRIWKMRLACETSTTNSQRKGGDRGRVSHASRRKYGEGQSIVGLNKDQTRGSQRQPLRLMGAHKKYCTRWQNASTQDNQAARRRHQHHTPTTTLLPRPRRLLGGRLLGGRLLGRRLLGGGGGGVLRFRLAQGRKAMLEDSQVSN